MEEIVARSQESQRPKTVNKDDDDDSYDEKVCTVKDDYTHLSTDIFYILESIPCPYNDSHTEIKKIYAKYTSQNVGCKCVSSCTFEHCSCLSMFSKNNQIGDIPRFYELSPNSEVILNSNAMTYDTPIFECSHLCSCTNSCGNRLVQFGPRKGLEIFQCPTILIEPHSETISKGLGLRTLNDIPKGGFICEYAGEIIPKSLAVERNIHNSKNSKMNFIICLNENSGNHRVQTFIDPTVFGNIGRYINHSCSPNCVMIPIRTHCPIPMLCFFAKEDIKHGTELTFSYGTIPEDFHSENRNSKSRCLCESKNCKKYLPIEDYS